MSGGSRKRMMHTTETEGASSTMPRYRHPLDTGDRGALVLWAQSRLAEQGLYAGPLDGRYRLDTVKAVRLLQDRSGLPVTGIIDRRTWDAL